MRLPVRDRRRTFAAALLLGPAAIVVACSDDDAAPAAVVDAGLDTFVPDSPPTDAGVESAAPCIPRAATGRTRLSETGLYEDIATKKVACDLIAYAPEFALWSDAAEKRRWVRLPPGTTIDASDPDHWVLPVGAQLFKEFALDGKRLETRLIERISDSGIDSVDYFYGAFAWRDDESDADFVQEGKTNVRATAHDIPSATQCNACHVGERGHALGFSALQLPHLLGELHDRGLIPSVEPKPIPGTPVERAAVGYLHANCGHCHNDLGSARPYTNMTLRFGYGETIAASKLWASTVGIATQSYHQDGIAKRIVAGDPDQSCVAYRPSIRDDAGAMPPIATEISDPAGVAAIRAWISSLNDGGAP